jgi:hypothetical protein
LAKTLRIALRNPVNEAIFDKTVTEHLSTKAPAFDAFTLAEGSTQGLDERISHCKDHQLGRFAGMPSALSES